MFVVPGRVEVGRCTLYEKEDGTLPEKRESPVTISSLESLAFPKEEGGRSERGMVLLLLYSLYDCRFC